MSTQLTLFSPDELLEGPYTADYVPTPYGYQRNSIISKHRPPFNLYYVDQMLSDPRIRFGLKMIKGPIITNGRFTVETEASKANKINAEKAQQDQMTDQHNSQLTREPIKGDYNVEAEDDNVGEYVLKTLERFWRLSAMGALRALEWGFSVSEVMWKLDKDGIYQFDRLLTNIKSLDSRIITCDGKYAGALIRNDSATDENKLTYLGGPKGFHHAHDRDVNLWYGMSILYGSFIPWMEKWSEGGFRDIRRTWFYKNSFEGGIMFHPPGTTRTKEGIIISNKDLGREMIEKKRTGATLTLPSNSDSLGKRVWEYQPPLANAVPPGLLEYGNDLNVEEYEGIGIPPEVFGDGDEKEVPKVAFYSTLQEKLNALVADFDEQIIRPGVAINFGPDATYEVIPQRLLGEPYAVEEQMDINSEDNPQETQSANQGRFSGSKGPNARKPTASKQ